LSRQLTAARCAAVLDYDGESKGNCITYNAHRF
jgi:hypothetical protein